MQMCEFRAVRIGKTCLGVCLPQSIAARNVKCYGLENYPDSYVKGLVPLVATLKDDGTFRE